MAARKYRKKGTSVLYTAHGFHFYKGAPIANWLVYYPAELLCSLWTDGLITINTEDYERAKRKFHAKETYYIPGVGIDTKKFHQISGDSHKMRQELGISENEVMLLSVGELSPRKNHRVVLEALGSLQKEVDSSKVHYFICGTGTLKSELEMLSHTLGLKENVHFLGYRSDISKLCQIADLYLFPSLQEGLPVALMEAVASRTPVLCSRIRGNEDLIKCSQDMFAPLDAKELFVLLKEKMADEKGEIKREYIKKRMAESVGVNYDTLSSFDLSAVEEDMSKIYEGGAYKLEDISDCFFFQKLLSRQQFLEELGIERDAFLLFSIGELNGNKNHLTILQALPALPSKLHYMIAGEGPLEEMLKKKAKELGVADRVHLLGYRTDVAKLLQIADGYLLPSIREGLNVSLMEAMASGLPCICSDIRGNEDLIKEKKGGYRIKSKDIKGWREKIEALYGMDKKERIVMGEYNRKAVLSFSMEEVKGKMKRIYEGS
jgi:glycosyltransferase EpsD